MALFRHSPVARAGDAAPLFSLVDHHGDAFDMLALRHLRRVVLVFFPDRGGPVTSHALEAFQASLPAFEARQATVIGICRASGATNAHLAKSLKLHIRLLADPLGAAGRPYGAWRLLMPGYRRRIVIVDGRGVVRTVWRGLPDVSAVLTYLDGLAGDLR